MKEQPTPREGPVFTSARNTGQSSRDEWETPPGLFRALDALFRFELDVCALPETAKCARFFTPAEDALSRDWAPAVCWMNPPYSDLGPWLEKASMEADRGAVVVALVPPRLDASYWHEWANRADRRIELQGRVQFHQEGSRRKQQNPHPSTLLVFDRAGRFSGVELGTPAPPVFAWDWRVDVDPRGLIPSRWEEECKREGCQHCGAPLPVETRSDALYCSTRCRVAAHRKKKKRERLLSLVRKIRSSGQSIPHDSLQLLGSSWKGRVDVTAPNWLERLADGKG